MPKQRPFEVHMTAIKSGSVDKSNIIGMRKAANALARDLNGWSRSRTAPTITIDEYNEIEAALAEIKPRVTGELHDTGVAMLQNKRYRKQLASVADIIAELDHFLLVGFETLGTRGEYHVPVYRACGKSGRSFPFYVVAWQSGGNGPTLADARYY